MYMALDTTNKNLIYYLIYILESHSEIEMGGKKSNESFKSDHD